MNLYVRPSEPDPRSTGNHVFFQLVLLLVCFVFQLLFSSSLAWYKTGALRGLDSAVMRTNSEDEEHIREADRPGETRDGSSSLAGRPEPLCASVPSFAKWAQSNHLLSIFVSFQVLALEKLACFLFRHYISPKQHSIKSQKGLPSSKKVMNFSDIIFTWM